MKNNEQTNSNFSFFGAFSYSNRKTRSCTGPELYEAVTQYRDLTMLPDLKEHDNALKMFLQNRDKKALFIFGPSGCGKHLLVGSHLAKNQIPFIERGQQTFVNPFQEEFNEFNGEGVKFFKIKGIREMIEESLGESTVTQVEIYEDFPLPQPDCNNHEFQKVQKFKQDFFVKLANATCKIIFILNSEIYNSYYILPREVPYSTDCIIMKPYTVTQSKHILKQFVSKHSVYSSIMENKDLLDEILQTSNGDIRKALLSFYLKTIQKGFHAPKSYRNREERTQHKIKLKNEQKFPLFHMLGKFLYAKRFDVQKNKDRTFSRDELLKTDPPFYFDPVMMYKRSDIPLNTFTDLLFENYPARFGHIDDVCEVSKLFVHIDSNFPAFIVRKRVDNLSEESQNIYIFLLTWGIILKNKSSESAGKRFSSFHKSDSGYVEWQARQKKQIIRKYFRNQRVTKMIRIGYIIRNSKTNKEYVISKLITQRYNFKNQIREQTTKMTDEEEEAISTQSKGINENEIRQIVRKKKMMEQTYKMIEREDEDSDLSDIDEINN